MGKWETPSVTELSIAETAHKGGDKNRPGGKPPYEPDCGHINPPSVPKPGDDKDFTDTLS